MLVDVAQVRVPEELDDVVQRLELDGLHPLGSDPQHVHDDQGGPSSPDGSGGPYGPDDQAIADTAGICITKAMNRPLTGGTVEAAAKPSSLG